MPELWNTERIRQELGAKTIRSAGRIILRLGLTPVAREPGRSGMNLYEADAVRAALAARKKSEPLTIYSPEND